MRASFLLITFSLCCLIFFLSGTVWFPSTTLTLLLWEISHATFLLEHNKGLKNQNFDFRAQFLTICTLILEAPVLHVREQLWAFVCYWCCWWFFLCRNVFLLYLQHNHTWQQYQLHKKEKCRKNLGIGTGKAWSFFSLTHCNKIWHYSHQNSIAMAYQSS